MSRFYMRCQASRGEATRCGWYRGHASVNSYSAGLEVSVIRDGSSHDSDVFTLKITCGSGSGYSDVTILTLTGEDIKHIVRRQDNVSGGNRTITTDMIDGTISMKHLYLNEYNKEVECGLNKKRVRV